MVASDSVSRAANSSADSGPEEQLVRARVNISGTITFLKVDMAEENHVQINPSIARDREFLMEFTDFEMIDIWDLMDKNCARLHVLIDFREMGCFQMENESETKKCPFCAEVIKFEAIACRYCGRDLPSSIQQPVSAFAMQPQAWTQQNQAIGLSIASLIIGIIASIIGLVDLSLIQDGSYDYLLDSEIGILAIMSFTSLGLGIAAKVKNLRVSTAALIVSIVSVVIFLACCSYTQYA